MTDIKYFLAKETIDDKDIDALCEWLKTRPRLTKDKKTLEFEHKWANYIGTKYAVFCDCGIRTHRDGIKVLFLEENIFECTRFPGRTGDHAPIHDAQTTHDMQVYRRIYSNSNCIGRVKIPLDNWSFAPAKWERRFGK